MECFVLSSQDFLFLFTIFSMIMQRLTQLIRLQAYVMWRMISFYLILSLQFLQGHTLKRLTIIDCDGCKDAESLYRFDEV